MTEAEREQLHHGAAVWGIELDSEAIDRFALFSTLLIEGNSRLNLTRVPPEEFVTRHYLDSLALFAIGQWQEIRTVLDVGTGAGFPGIPLAIVRPEWQITLLDSTRKRLLFLDDVIAKLKLPNVRTVHSRAEEFNRNAPESSHFDLVVSRAVAPMTQLVEWCLPHVKPNGLTVAYKSSAIAAELTEALPTLQRYDGNVELEREITIPYCEIVRKLIGIRKTDQANLTSPPPRHRIKKSA